MKRLASIFALSVLALGAGTALAQPTPLPVDPEGDEEPPPPDGDEPPPPPVQTRLAPAVGDEPATVAVVVAEPVDPRPTAFSVALGFGYVLPAAWRQPNITSVRFRLGSGLTIEPTLSLTHDSTTVDSGPVEASVPTNIVEVGALVRIPLRTNRKADLEIVGGLSVGNTTSNPDGVDNADSRTQASAVYGLAVTYWFTPHFQLSMTGLNPIVVYDKHSEDMPMGMETVTTSTQIGAVWDPTVIGMLHLYL